MANGEGLGSDHYMVLYLLTDATRVCVTAHIQWRMEKGVRFSNFRRYTRLCVGLILKREDQTL